MREIEAVLFDLDGTLLRYRRSPDAVLQASFDRVGVDPLFPVEDYYDRYDEFAQQCDSMAELRSECFATLAVENGYDASLGRAVATAFDAERDQSNVAFYPDVPAVLESLSERYEIGIVTNGTRDAQRRKLEAVDLDRWTDTTVIAGQDPPPKPASEPFERALESLDATPATTVHVGDSREADIRGATNAGLRTVWVSGGGDESGCGDGSLPTYRVGSVGNLLPPPWERSDS